MPGDEHLSDAVQGVRHDLADLEPAVRTALVEWSLGSPRVDAMINATQAFATRTFTAPKVPQGLGNSEDHCTIIAGHPLTAATVAQLCEVLAQTLVGFRQLIGWRTRLEPGRRFAGPPSGMITCCCQDSECGGAAGYIESSRARCCKFNKGLPRDLVEAVRRSQVPIVLCSSASGRPEAIMFSF